MRRNDNARAGGPPGTGAAATSSCLADSHYFTDDPEGRQQVRQVHDLGPKPLGHLFDEIERDPTNVRGIVGRFSAIDPVFVEALNGRDWVERTDVIRVVRSRA
jgi:hypothetical protein